jgi:lysophospholipase L1-like esterase
MDRPASATQSRRRVARAAAGLLLAILSAACSLLLVEGGLRIAGFEYHLTPIVQVGWPDPQTIGTRYADEPDLFWVTRDYFDKLREARRTHPAIIFMGDSCTEFGTYPAETIAQLAAAHGSVVTGVHLAVGGWTSEQGLAQLGRDIVPLHPRVIVVYYGWNDHWIALGPTDPELRQARRFLWLSAHSRVVQLALKVRMGLAARHAKAENRVPLKRYVQNLDAIAATAKRAGIVPVFVTAPSNHISGHEPAYLLRRHVRALAEVVPLHNQYVAATRDAAKASGAVLCDAVAAFDALPPPRDQYFQRDGIHFTRAGDRQLAGIVSSCIAPALQHAEPR